MGWATTVDTPITMDTPIILIHQWLQYRLRLLFIFNNLHQLPLNNIRQVIGIIAATLRAIIPMLKPVLMVGSRLSLNPQHLFKEFIMSRSFLMVLITALLATTGCATLPNGPSVMVLPGTGMTFDRFRSDDAVCQQYAFSQIGGVSPNQAGVNSGITSAVVGTAVGAAAGAAFGGGTGAAIGAGSGLLAGSLIGTGVANNSMYADQQRYDAAYVQCMYAKGHQVPVVGQFSGATSSPIVVHPSTVPPPPPTGTNFSSPAGSISPPPAGTPPPPPTQ
jgi:outer membrane lipoprotein SlyB